MREKDKELIQNIVIFGLIIVFVIAFIFFPYQLGKTTSSYTNLEKNLTDTYKENDLFKLNY